jgi:hypothetical protein
MLARLEWAYGTNKQLMITFWQTFVRENLDI